MAEVLYRDDELRFYVFWARDVPDGVPRTGHSAWPFPGQYWRDWVLDRLSFGESREGVLGKWTDWSPTKPGDWHARHCAVAFEHAAPLLVGFFVGQRVAPTPLLRRSNPGIGQSVVTQVRTDGVRVNNGSAVWSFACWQPAPPEPTDSEVEATRLREVARTEYARTETPRHFVGQLVRRVDAGREIHGDVLEVYPGGGLRVRAAHMDGSTIWAPGVWDPVTVAPEPAPAMTVSTWGPYLIGAPAKPESPLAEVARKLGEATRPESKMILATYRGTPRHFVAKATASGGEGYTFIAPPGAWMEPAPTSDGYVQVALPGSVVFRADFTPEQAQRFVEEIEAAGARQRRRILNGIEEHRGRLTPTQSRAWSDELRARVEASARADADREARLSGWDPYGDDL